VLPLSRLHDDFLDDLDTKQKRACQVALCADWMAAVFTAADKRLALVRSRQLMLECFDFDQSIADEILSQIPDALIGAAEALGVSIGEQWSFEEVEQNANRWFIERQQERDQLIHSLEEALSQRERLAEELQKAYARLAQQAYYDPLTSLANRRRFNDIFCGEVARHGRSSHTLSLMIMDLDGFKDINDNHGHLIGDEVLREVAQIAKRTLRASDVAGRLGGDEICLLLPETDLAGGSIAAERVRGAVEGLRFEHEDVSVTSSIGGTTWMGKNIMRSEEIEQVRGDLLSLADKALYAAKKNGRNQVAWKSVENAVM